MRIDGEESRIRGIEKGRIKRAGEKTVSAATDSYMTTPPRVGELMYVLPLDSVMGADDAALTATIRAELEAMLDDPSLRTRACAQRGPVPADTDPEQVLARAFGRRLYEYHVENKDKPDHSASGFELMLRQHTYAAPSSSDAIRVEVRRHEVLLRLHVGRLPFRLPVCVDEEDVLQQASVAVLEALRTYVPWRGKLQDWLEISVRNGVRSWLRNLHPLSGHRTAQIREVAKAWQRVEQRGLRPPNENEVARELGWSVDVLRNVREAAYTEELLSLDDMDVSVHIGNGEAEPFDQVWTQKCQEQLVRSMRRLPVEQRQILTYHYVQEMSLREIARQTGFNHTSVVRKHQDALLHLRSRLEGDQPPHSNGQVKTGSARQHRHAKEKRTGTLLWRTVTLGGWAAALKRFFQGFLRFRHAPQA